MEIDLSTVYLLFLFHGKSRRLHVFRPILQFHLKQTGPETLIGHLTRRTSKNGDVKMPRKLPKGRSYMAVCQNLVPLVNIKIAGKWMFIPLKMVLIGIDPYPYEAIGQEVWSTESLLGTAKIGDI